MKKWPSGQEEKKLVNLREEGASIADVAKMAGVSQETARLHLDGIIPLGRLVSELVSYPDELLQIRGDCAITSDWHSPFFSMKWLERLVAVCRKLEICQLAIVGDLTDFKWLSRYMKKDQRDNLADEFSITISLLQFLLGVFDRVYWSRGNHEDRLLITLGGHDVLPVLAHMIDESRPGDLYSTPAPSMLLDDTWRLEHPKSYSQNATVISSKLASILHRNVASAHGHFIGYTHDLSGRYIGLDIGGMFDVEKQEYLHLGGATTHPRWNPGFWIYKDGKPRAFDDALVNWADFDVNGVNGPVK